ncbi:MAG: GspE/PulE family protein [bacterium]|jgi:type II secretory ATPase GspE/PulE/Tfp pilus assembly ATPase PilB-like protein
MKRLGEILVSGGKIKKEQLDDALLSQQISEQRLGEILIEKGYATDEDISRALSVQAGLDLCLNLQPAPGDDLINRTIGSEFLYNQNCVAITKNGRKYLACVSLTKDIADKISLESAIAGAEVVLSTKHAIYTVLNSFFISAASGASDMSEQQMLDEVLELAIAKNSPNLRIKKSENTYLLQIDTISGIETVRILTLASGIKLINIIAGKCDVNLNLGESKDAKMIYKSKLYKGLKVNIRLEFLPVTAKIDKDKLHEAVLRLHGLNKVMSLESLGLDAEHVTILQGIYTYPHGMVIATGPCGSGKTTMFYGSVKLLSGKKKSIFTIEDPVEIELKEPNITQMNVSENFGYAEALKAMLRSEPHIIMVGEIRDEQTAKHTLEAAQTGHLVLTTLHTNSALGIFSRLKTLDADIDAFLESVRLVTGQRLYSPLCPECKKIAVYNDIPIYFRKALEKNIEKISTKEIYIRGGESCKYCGGTGYAKRRAIMEIAVFTDAVKKEIRSRGSFNIQDMEDIFIKHGGFKSLKVLAEEKLKSGEIDPSQYFQIAG